MSVLCLIALGSNIGDRRDALERAVAMLRRRDDLSVIAVSTWHETAPVGGPAGQEAFLNGAAVLETSLFAKTLVAALQQVEQSLGRERHERWAARTIDLDLLLYGDAVIESPQVRVPHPRMSFRRFVLEPAVEVAAQMVHPEIGWTLQMLLDHLNSTPNYVAIAGGEQRKMTQLAEDIVQALGGRLVRRDVDSAGRELERAIRFLDEASGELAGSEIAQDRLFRANLLVSDFWRPEVARPKLIVALESPDENIDAFGYGPVLQLDASSDPSLWLTEVSAAIDAMQ